MYTLNNGLLEVLSDMQCVQWRDLLMGLVCTSFDENRNLDDFVDVSLSTINVTN